MTDEQRTFKRFHLRLRVLVFRPGLPVPVLGETHDISREGCLCYFDQAFSIGERLRCLILLSDPLSHAEAKDGLCIDAQVEVIQVIPDQSTLKFGVGYRMHEYRVMSRGVVGAGFLDAQAIPPNSEGLEC